LEYFKKDYEYRFYEARDLISYTLNLTKDEINNIMLHLFEVKGLVNDYYFLSRNCSSELLKLIDFAREDLDISKNLSFVTKPIDIVYILEKHKFISSIEKHLSSMKLFHNYFEKLDLKSKKIVVDIVNNKISIPSLNRMSNIDLESKKFIILASIKIIEINSLTKKVTSKDMSKLLKLITLKEKYNITKFKKDKIVLKSNPITNKSHKLKLGYINGKKNWKTIGYRHLYTNRLDMLNDMKGFGSIELLDITLKYNNHDIEIDQFILMNLESLPTSNLFFKELTTQMQLGSKRIEYFEDKLYTYFKYAIGYNYKLNKFFYARASLEAGIYYHNEEVYNGSFNSTLEYSHKNKFISELSYSYKKYDNGIIGTTISLANNIKLSQNSSFNIEIKEENYKNKMKSISFNYNLFF